MGVAILSGVLTSLETRLSSTLSGPPGYASTEHDSNLSKSTNSQIPDAPDEALPSRFIATVGREETGRKLRKTFAAMGRLGAAVEIIAGEGNVEAAKEADVVLVW